MIKNHKRVIFHLDMDAFFASIELRDNPHFQGQPIIVGALPGHRGVVSTANYEARKYGVHSALPINQAYARCPHGIFLKPRMTVYIATSKKVMAILRSFSPQIEQLSIDEAFIDMTGTEKLWGEPMQTAKKISKAIQDQLDLTASIGIAPNKFLAKLASDLNKPNGITLVPFHQKQINSWLAPLPVSKIWGVGKKTTQILLAKGIQLIGDLQKVPKEELIHIFGKQGKELYSLCHGIDHREIEKHGKAKSISRETTFNEDSSNPEHWFRTLLTLSRDVAKRTRKSGCRGRTIVLTFRTPDFKRHSRRITLNNSTNLAKLIFEQAVILLKKEIDTLTCLRLIGVGLTNFDDAGQINLFDFENENQTWQASEKAMDTIAERFGKNVIFRGAELIGKKKKNPKKRSHLDK